MKKIVLGFVLVAAVALHGCFGPGDDEATDDRTYPSGIPLLDGGQQFDDGEICTESPPKVGESCPQGFPEEKVCRFDTEACTRRGKPYDDFVEYCCVRGLWELCGSLSRCAELPPDDDADASADAAPPSGD